MDTTRDNRDIAAEILAEIAQLQPAERSRIIGTGLSRSLPPRDGISSSRYCRCLLIACLTFSLIDADTLSAVLKKWKEEGDILNGYVVSALCDLEARETLPLIRKVPQCDSLARIYV